MKSCLLHTPFCLLFAAIVFTGGDVFAQSMRSLVNNGVDLYDKGKFVDSEVEFKKGLERSPDNFQANFNLGDSYYKEGKYEDALKNYSAALSKATMDNQKAAVYHNTGNALLKDQKIKESIGAYEDALKLNPNDVATKYNLSYALDLLKNQNQQNKNNQSQNDKNKNDQGKQPQNQNQQNQNKNKQKNQQQNQQNAPNEISKDQAQAIFNALNNDEKNLQKQLRRMKGEPIKTDKDW
jgi:predicted Zn-dependent protease